MSNDCSRGRRLSPTILNVIAIFAQQTTHVILDVAGCTMPGFEFAKFTAAAASTRNARLQRAQQAMRVIRAPFARVVRP